MSNKGRILVWFSCGVASACAAKLACEKYKDELDSVEVLYCNTLAYEHPDNTRFMSDVERWIGKPIKLLSNPKYNDIYDVFTKTRFLVGVAGARCTRELKQSVRKAYQKPEDVHVFGYVWEEKFRIQQLEKLNPGLELDWILYDQHKTKQDCLDMIRQAGIDIPVMYKLGYNNNNCIGCVKGGKGYWNKIRTDFPAAFEKMAKLERELGRSVLKDQIGTFRFPVWLDELDPNAGRHEQELDIECGAICHR